MAAVCQVHFKKNILDKVRNKDKAWVKQKLDDIFLAPDKETGLERLQKFVVELSEKYPDAADLLEQGGEDALSCLNFPEQHRRRIRTTNSLELFNQEIKRRTSIIRIFPNRKLCIKAHWSFMHGTGGRMDNRETVHGHDTALKKGCKRKENHTSGESGCLTHFTEHFGLDRCFLRYIVTHYILAVTEIFTYRLYATSLIIESYVSF
ncbi:MAG: transposase [Candidatus Marinimicrobia bacterium]|nr:transposase [Candidatus Neomarinimicrobiota bacterium]